MEDSSLHTTAIERLTERLSRKQKEFEILGEIFSQMRSSIDLNVILHNILEQLDHYFGFDHSMILLSNKQTLLKVVASHGYPTKGIGAKVEIGKGIIGTAAKRKQLIRMGNISMRLIYTKAGEDFENLENEIIIKLPGLTNPMSQVAIPLLKQDELIGVLSVESTKTNLFKEDDEQIIHLIANQAAIVIQQAAMFEAEKQRFLEIESINRKLSDLTEIQQSTLSLFVKYVPEAVVKKALRERPDSMFEGEQVNVAVLFCDIRDFTPMSENLTPKQVVSVLNIYYSRMSEVIRREGGVINQFVGDEIFVIFGAPVPLVNYEERAVMCAIGMIQQLECINKELDEQFGVSIRVGIGLNSGPVVTGNLGCSDKIAYSVTGDTVNTGKRIESLTKEQPNSILASDAVYQQVAHLVTAKAWEPVAVKGKNEKIVVWEVQAKAEE
jgi:class 3 adenylate cyclase